MLSYLPNDILDNIYYNNILNNEIIDTKILIEEKIMLSNLMLINKPLFKFIILKYEKLFLSNFQPDYKYMSKKFNMFYEVHCFEDYSIIDTIKFKNCKILCLRSCYNITNVSSLGNIQYLDLSNCEYIKDVSMLGKCKKLELANCHNITDVSQLGNVPYLDLSHCSKITNISQLGNHKYLNLRGTNICNVNSLKNVEVLDISYNYNIYNISSLKNVKKLDISYCFNVELTTIMNNDIFIAEDTNLVDDDILYLKNINELRLRKNNYISDLSPLIKTKHLDIRQCSNIRILPQKNILESIDVSASNYNYNLVSLGINDLNIKDIVIYNFP